MTDRIKGFYVALEDDMRVDDAEHILDAVRQLRGVAAVQHSITEVDDWMNRAKVQNEMRDKIFKVLTEVARP